MLHNLLPKESKKELRNEYLVRMLSVATFLLAVSVLVGTASLAPSLISLSSALDQYQSQVDAGATTTEQAPVRELGRVAGLLETLNAKLDTEPMTELLDDVVAVRPTGIELTGITFERSPLSFSLRGVATTRDALVTYKRSLEGLERVTEVSSPISDLAKSSDLEFTLAVQLSEQKL